MRRLTQRLGAVAVLLAVLAPAVTGFSSYGDRHGQLRQSMFSSYGRKGDDHTTDPRMWKNKGTAKKREGGYELVLPGSRAALAMHANDQDTLDKMKGAKAQKRSLSLRSRSTSLSRSRSKSTSGSKSATRSKSNDLTTKNKARLVAYLDAPQRSKWEIMRVLRFSGVRKQDLAPIGKWTSKSRPKSLIPPARLTPKQKLRARALRIEQLEEEAEAAKSGGKGKKGLMANQKAAQGKAPLAKGKAAPPAGKKGKGKPASPTKAPRSKSALPTPRSKTKKAKGV